MSATMTNRKHSKWWHNLCKICETGNQLSWFDSRIKWVLEDRKYKRFWDGD